MNKDIYVIAHNIRSLHNVGSIFRTSEAAGVTKLFLTGYSGVPPRKEIDKTALGAQELVPWEYHQDPLALIKTLKEQSVQILALEKNNISQPIQTFTPTFPWCLILGNEVDGVDETILQQSDAVLEIPMLGQKTSLNVSVAFGIGVYQLR